MGIGYAVLNHTMTVTFPESKPVISAYYSRQRQYEVRGRSCDHHPFYISSKQTSHAPRYDCKSQFKNGDRLLRYCMNSEKRNPFSLSMQEHVYEV